MDKTIFSESLEETQRIAKDFIQNLGEINFVALFGDLGSGKTSFVQGLAKPLGVKERIISPTFIIVRNHELKNKTFYHIDLYRLENKGDIKGLGLKEIFADSNNLVAVEWAEKIKEILPNKRAEVYFENLGKDKRKITFKIYE